jgi:hypothetical protein
VPDQDCCTLFTPRNPLTRAKREDIERAEQALPIGEMVERARQTEYRDDRRMTIANENWNGINPQGSRISSGV